MLAHGERSRIHRLAAQALWLGGSTAGDAADHLMRSDGAGDGWATEVLRAAARQTLEPGPRGRLPAPRALRGPVRPRAGRAARRSWPRPSSPAAARRPLGTWPRRSSCCRPAAHRAEAREQLGRVLWGLGRYEEAGRAFEDGVGELGQEGGAVGPRLRASLRGCAPASARRRTATDRRSTRCRSSRTWASRRWRRSSRSSCCWPVARMRRVVELAADGARPATACCASRPAADRPSRPPSARSSGPTSWRPPSARPRVAIEDARTARHRAGARCDAAAARLRAACAQARLRRGRAGAPRRPRGRAPALLPVPAPAGRTRCSPRSGWSWSARRRAAGGRAAVDASAAEADRTAAGAIQHALALNARGVHGARRRRPDGRPGGPARMRPPPRAMPRCATRRWRRGARARRSRSTGSASTSAPRRWSPRSSSWRTPSVRRARSAARCAARACTRAARRAHARPAGGRRGARPLACASSSSPTRSPTWARSCAAAGTPARLARGAAQLPRPGRPQRRGHAREARPPGSRRHRRAAAPGAHQRRRLAHSARAPDRGDGRPGPVQPGDRRPPDREPEDDRVAPRQRVPQARDPRSRRPGRARWPRPERFGPRRGARLRGPLARLLGAPVSGPMRPEPSSPSCSRGWTPAGSCEPSW